MYLKDRCRCDIRVQRPQKHPSNVFRQIMLQIPVKLYGTTFMRSTLDNRYNGDRYRRDIRAQRPQKPQNNKYRLIMLQIPIKL